MKAIIEEYEFNNVNWQVNNAVGVLSLPPSESIVSIIEICNSATEVTIYDDDVFVGRWHIFNILSIENKSTIDVSFQINRQNDENSSFEELEQAIMDLGQVMDSLNQNLIAQKSLLNTYFNQMKVIENTINNRINNQQSMISNIENIVNPLRNQSVILQNQINAFPKNTNSRLGELETGYNKIADRVTLLERRV